MAKGTSTAGDIVLATIDGVSTLDMWTEYQQTLSVLNDHRSGIENLFTFGTTQSCDFVAQAQDVDMFEEQSEFGQPVGLRSDPGYVQLGYDFKDYDVATRFTARFLRDATAAQVDSVHNAVIAADQKTLWVKIMSAIYSNTDRMNVEGQTVYSLWNGSDGQTPPSYLLTTFDSSHNHYTISSAAAIDSGDAEAVISQVQEHGYGVNDGERILLLVNPAQGRSVRGWRAGVANANSAVAEFDFIPAEGTPAYLTNLTLVGAKPPAQYGGLNVIGSYGPALVIEDPFIPAGYVTAVATAGPGSTLNVLGFREHPSAVFRGLRLIGNQSEYPLTDAFYSRSFGTGVRNRGAAAVIQIKATGSYVAPGF